MPKTFEHRAAISEGVKLWHSGARRRMTSVLDAMESATFKSAADVAKFEVIIRDLVEAFSAVMAAAKSTQGMLAAENADLRRQLEQRGGDIKMMSTISLRQSKSYGLLPAETVAEEFERRRSTTMRIGNVLPGTNDTMMSWNAAAGQFEVLDRSKPGRQFITAGMVAVDLDSNLRQAEYQFEQAERQMAEASAEVEAARSASKRYDDRNRVNGADDGG